MFLKLASQESLTLEKEGWVVLGGGVVESQNIRTERTIRFVFSAAVL